MGSGAKSYMLKGFLNMRKCANISPYMRRPLVIYEFAPDPSEFPYIRGKFSFLFYQCTIRHASTLFSRIFTEEGTVGYVGCNRTEHKGQGLEQRP